MKFGITHNYSKKASNGEWQDVASFFDVNFFGKGGEAILSYATKGRRVAVDGRLRQDRWNQQGEKKTKIYIDASYVQLLDSSSSQSSMNSHPHKTHITHPSPKPLAPPGNTALRSTTLRSTTREDYIREIREYDAGRGYTGEYNAEENDDDIPLF